MRQELAKLVNKTVRFAGKLVCAEEERFLLQNVVVSSYYNSSNKAVLSDHIWFYEAQTIHLFSEGFGEWKEELAQSAETGMSVSSIGVIKQYCRKDRSFDYGIIVKPCMTLSTQIDGIERKPLHRQVKIIEETLQALKQESLLFGVNMSYSQVKEALNITLKKVKQSIKAHDERVAKQFRGKLNRDPFVVPKQYQCTAKGFSK